jgi:hypothetical protein
VLSGACQDKNRPLFIRSDEFVAANFVEFHPFGSEPLKSPHQFMGIKQAPLAVRFDINPPSVQQVLFLCLLVFLFFMWKFLDKINSLPLF